MTVDDAGWCATPRRAAPAPTASVGKKQPIILHLILTGCLQLASDPVETERCLLWCVRPNDERTHHPWDPVRRGAGTTVIRLLSPGGETFRRQSRLGCDVRQGATRVRKPRDTHEAAIPAAGTWPIRLGPSALRHPDVPSDDAHGVAADMAPAATASQCIPRSHRTSFKKSWRALFALAGLDWGRAKGLTWHTTRHEFISRVVDTTKNPRDAQEAARHKRLETTQRYMHSRRDRRGRWHMGSTAKPIFSNRPPILYETCGLIWRGERDAKNGKD